MEHAGGDGNSDGDGDKRGAGRGKGRGSGWTPNQQHPQQQLRRPQAQIQKNANQSPATTEDYSNKGEFHYRGVTSSNLSVDAPEFVPRNLEPSPTVQQGYYRQPAQDRINLVRNQQPVSQQQQQLQQQQQQQQQMRSMHYVPYGRQQQYGFQPQQMHFQNQQYADPDASLQGYPPYDSSFGNYNRQRRIANGSERQPENTPPWSFTSVLRQLEHAMDTLNSSPGQFDDLVVPLVSSLTPHLKDSSRTREIVDSIVKQSINESNFRYSGARLCAHLDAIATPSEDSTESFFRHALYNRCHAETEVEKLKWLEDKNPNEKSCNGLMLCLAELVAQMDQAVASVLGKLLVQIFSFTLKNPAPNTAKFICLSLKLAGQYLERDSSTNRDAITAVMNGLTELVTTKQVDVHVGRMVYSVRDLRSGNWGRVVSSHGPTPVEPSTTIEQQIPEHSFDEPVLYGPDGTVLSAEESSFCQSRATADGIYDDGGDPHNRRYDITSYEDAVEDDAIAVAYEEFLKLLPNKTGGSVADRE